MKHIKYFFMLSMLLGAWTNSNAQSASTLFDAGWQFTRNGKTINVDLPHDWDIYEAPDPATGATKEGGGWFQGGKGEYRKQFKVERQAGNAALRRCLSEGRGIRQRTESWAACLWLYTIHGRHHTVLKIKEFKK